MLSMGDHIANVGVHEACWSASSKLGCADDPYPNTAPGKRRTLGSDSIVRRTGAGVDFASLARSGECRCAQSYCTLSRLRGS